LSFTVTVTAITTSRNEWSMSVRVTADLRPELPAGTQVSDSNRFIADWYIGLAYR